MLGSKVALGCILAQALILSPCGCPPCVDGAHPSGTTRWSLAASQVNPVPAFQGQAFGTQTFAHPEKLPHTLQLAEVLVLRHQIKRDSG